jgi:hypothetical protein
MQKMMIKLILTFLTGPSYTAYVGRNTNNNINIGVPMLIMISPIVAVNHALMMPLLMMLLPMPMLPPLPTMMMIVMLMIVRNRFISRCHNKEDVTMI